jgi:hypothetical protein
MAGGDGGFGGLNAPGFGKLGLVAADLVPRLAASYSATISGVIPAFRALAVWKKRRCLSET